MRPLIVGCSMAILGVAFFILAVITCVPAHAAKPHCHGTAGRASWYGSESGSITASGRRFDPNGLSAAHRSLPFGTVLTVTDMHSGRSVRVVVLDRGPAARTGREIDLSRGAAVRLGMIKRGVAWVCISKPCGLCL